MRILPVKRWRRVASWLLIGLVYAAILWVWVFPWVDRTFVNNPAV